MKLNTNSIALAAAILLLADRGLSGCGTDFSAAEWPRCFFCKAPSTAEAVPLPLPPQAAGGRQEAVIPPNVR